MPLGGKKLLSLAFASQQHKDIITVLHHDKLMLGMKGSLQKATTGCSLTVSIP
jgi:hypothetical protein